MDEWTWAEVDEGEWALFRDGERSRGRVALTKGRYLGVWDTHPVAKEDSLEEAKAAVEVETRSRPWLPHL